MKRLVGAVTNAVFALRTPLLVLFALITAAMLCMATGLRIDAGFEKYLPIGHDYMETFKQYRAQFGGANRVLVSVRVTKKDQDIFTPEFMAALKHVTDQVFFLKGVDKSRVFSLFTPNVRFVEIIEDGFAGGTVIPADFQPPTASADELEIVRQNTLKSGQVGRLVAEDFTAALVSAQLLERDPDTGELLDYQRVAHDLEAIRADLAAHMTQEFGPEAAAGLEVNIIGFAKMVGDIAEGASDVVLFFAIAFVITGLLVWLYCHSFRLTLLPLVCSLVAVIWQLGLLVTFGFGIDPMSILVPFLVFAIGVSHGVQMINAMLAEIYGEQYDGNQGARVCFARLLVPGMVALLSDTVGFLTILFIPIPIIRELAITASLGVAVIILTNLFLLPLLMSTMRFDSGLRDRVRRGVARKEKLWRALGRFTRPGLAFPVAGAALLLWAAGAFYSQRLPIGDLEAGVPELWPDSRYNRDAGEITNRYAIGVDIIQIIAEAPNSGCVRYPVMKAIDEFEWQVRNVEGVRSTISMAQAMKLAYAGFNEGNPAWRVLSRNKFNLAQAADVIETSTGLKNDTECAIMPVVIFTTDHRAETIARIVARVKDLTAAGQGEAIAGITGLLDRFAAAGGALPEGVALARRAVDLFTVPPPPQDTALEVDPRHEHPSAAAERAALQADLSAAFDAAIAAAPAGQQAGLRAIADQALQLLGEHVRFRLATGNVGVMAATNEAVAAAQLDMLIYVYGAIIVLCLLTFRSIWATLCTVLPLTLVSVLCYALMAALDIGLKISTLPVAALGVGIGVDYGIYIFSRMKTYLDQGRPLGLSYLQTLRETGSAVIFTGLTLAIGVSSWAFSSLKFQADMGVLLTFMFLVNMLGAILVLPALARVLAPFFKDGRRALAAEAGAGTP